MELSRRDLMKYGLLGSAAMLLPLERVARTQLLLKDRMPTSGLPKPFELDWKPTVTAIPRDTGGNTDRYIMRMRAVQADVLGRYKNPSRPLTTIWGYERITPGPTIKVKRGRRVAVRHTQELPDTHPDHLYPASTSVHHHGSASLPQYDGYASDVTMPGYFKDYYYPNYQDARTLWYHDHGIHHTANNAYMGLAAQYHIVDDAVDSALNLPTGDYDQPLVVRDAMFAKNGELVYADNSEAGVYGDVILVNGVPWPSMPVEARKYRFRILNASISRSYSWRLSNGAPLTVFATDGGLMKNPQAVKSFRHGMAERYEVIIDFTGMEGQTVKLLNDSPPNNIKYDNTDKVMQFVVGKSKVKRDEETGRKTGNPGRMCTEAVDPVTGARLYNDEVWDLTPSMVTVKRNFEFERKNGHWTVNGETWENVIESDYRHSAADPKAGDVEQWTLHNPGGGWFHPVHIHLIDFKVISRTNGNVKGVLPHELGPKDVVYLGEGEKVDVLIKFDDARARLREAAEASAVAGRTVEPLAQRTGRYMMHCHNLVHEDHDMMVQWEVKPNKDLPGPTPNDPEIPWSPRSGAYPGDSSQIDKKDALPMSRADLAAMSDAEAKQHIGLPVEKDDRDF
jgi:spore coat protein A, manganese oxidase